MKNKLADGKTARYTATANLAAGGIALLYGRVGVAISPIAAGEEGILDMTGGVFAYTLTTGISGGKTKGAGVYLGEAATESNGADLEFAAGAGKTLIGHLEETVLDGGTKIKVRLLEVAVSLSATELTIADIKAALGISSGGSATKFMNEKGAYVAAADFINAALGISAGGDVTNFLNEQGGFTKPGA